MTEPAVWFPAIRAGTGADVFTRRLCDGLNRRGIRAEVAWLPHRAEYLPWSVAVPSAPAWANVVHVNTWLHRRFVPRRLPLVATMHHCVHDEALRPYKSGLQAFYHRRWVRPLEAWILDRADRVVAVSRYTARRTREAFGRRDIRVVHNGVPESRMADVPAREPHSPFRLLYVGGWSVRKGVDLLGPIMEALGDGFELWYTADRSRPGLSGVNARCLGRPDLDDLRRAYRDADALVFPSRLEGFGLVAAEAMAAGLPVVAARTSAIPEVVKDGVSGILCAADDVRAFCDAVRVLRDQSETWRAMSSAGPRIVSSEFGMDQCLDAYEHIYRELVANADEL